MPITEAAREDYTTFDILKAYYQDEVRLWSVCMNQVNKDKAQAGESPGIVPGTGQDIPDRCAAKT